MHTSRVSEYGRNMDGIRGQEVVVDALFCHMIISLHLFMWQLLKALIWWTKTTKTGPQDSLGDFGIQSPKKAWTERRCSRPAWSRRRLGSVRRGNLLNRFHLHPGMIQAFESVSLVRAWICFSSFAGLPLKSPHSSFLTGVIPPVLTFAPSFLDHEMLPWSYELSISII